MQPWKGLSIGALISIALVGCNNDDAQQQVRVGSGVSLDPASIDWEVQGSYDADGNCLINPGHYNDTYLTARVVNEEGAPLGGIDLRVTADLTGNSYTGFHVIQVYSDANGNGVADPSELVLGPGMPAYDTRTGRYTGEINLIARVNLSCTFKGNIFVAGTPGGAATSVSVTAEPPPDATEEPIDPVTGTEDPGAGTDTEGEADPATGAEGETDGV
ncbi:hypothetical protein [Allohahella sp. A8]|uniref:hypothetical protein n=1 Tax=Allohahella sp. A8 TaxID=3141461 RepID=UPI003A80C7E3